VAAFAAAVLINFLVAYNLYRSVTPVHPVLPWPGRQIAAEEAPYCWAAELPKGSRVLLVGQGGQFYFPAGSLYATVFDESPLTALSRRTGGGPGAGADVPAGLRAAGVTHVWAAWAELWLAAHTVGLEESIGEDLLRRARAGLPPGLAILEHLPDEGARLVRAVYLERDAEGRVAPVVRQAHSQPTTASGPSTSPAPAGPSESGFPADWPVLTIYALPWAPDGGAAATGASAPALPRAR